MAITHQQLKDLGFKPAKRNKDLNAKEYDSLVYPINKTDYLYLGYNGFRKSIDFKRLWKSFYDSYNDEQICYEVQHIGDLSYSNVKEYIERTLKTYELREQLMEELGRNKII